MAKRFFLNFDDFKQSYEILNNSTIGSGTGVEIIIPSQDIAPKHATFKIHNDVLSIIDLGGPKGTYLDSKRLGAQKVIILEVDDKIVFGGSVNTSITEESLYQDSSAAPQNSTKDDDKTFHSNNFPKPQSSEPSPSANTVIEALPMTTNGDIQVDQLSSKLKVKGATRNEIKPIEPTDTEARVQFENPAEASDIEEKESVFESKTKLIKLKLVERTEKIKESTAKTAKKTKDGIVDLFSNRGRKPPSLFFRWLVLLFDILILFTFLNVLVKQLGTVKGFLDLQLTFNEDLKIIIERGFEALAVYPLPPEISEYITPILSPVHSFINEWLYPHSLLIVLFFGLRILCAVLFGRSLGQIALGMNYDNRFITKRIKALLRLILEPLLSWTLIGELLSLFKCRTLKDHITLSRSYIDINATVVGFPLIILIVLLANNFNSAKQLIEASPSSIQSDREVYSIAPPADSNLENIASKIQISENIALSTDLLGNKILILATSNNKKLDAIIFNPTTNDSANVEITFSPEDLLIDALRSHAQFSLTFPIHYPTLYRYLVLAPEYSEKYQYNPAELAKYVSNIYLLSADSWKEFLLAAVDPFTDSYLFSRQELDHMIDHNVSSIKIYHSKEATYVRSEASVKKNGQKITFTPVLSKAPAISVEYTPTKQLVSSIPKIADRLPSAILKTEKAKALFLLFTSGQLQNSEDFIQYLSQLHADFPNQSEDFKMILKDTLTAYGITAQSHKDKHKSYEQIILLIDEILKRYEIK